jgi:histone H1/5
MSEPKKKAAPPAHPSYQEMIKKAILELKDRKGASRQAILKHVQDKNPVGDNAALNVKKALKKGLANGVFEHNKENRARFKLSEAEKKSATEKKPAKKPVKKPAAPKSKTTQPKKPAAKTTKKPTKPAKKTSKSPAKKGKSPAKPKTKKPTSKAATKKAGAKKATPKKVAKKPAAKKATKAKK